MVHKEQKKTFVRGKQCPICNSVYKKRVQRKFWMRLIPWCKHYICGDCNCAYLSFSGSVSYRMTYPRIENGSIKMVNHQG